MYFDGDFDCRRELFSGIVPCGLSRGNQIYVYAALAKPAASLLQVLGKEDRRYVSVSSVGRRLLSGLDKSEKLVFGRLKDEEGISRIIADAFRSILKTKFVAVPSSSDLQISYLDSEAFRDMK